MHLDDEITATHEVTFLFINKVSNSSKIATMEVDPYETCPYDKIHRIRRSRMQFHIKRCSMNFPNSEKMQCPFDACHKVNQVDFKDHVDHCPARESLFDDNTTSQAEPNILPIDVNSVKVSDVEKWDADFQTYSPLQAIQDKPIVYPIIGLSKAKRKNHRLQERIRYNQIMKNGGNQKINETSIQPNEEDEQEEKPLRPPYHICNKTNGAGQNKNQNLILSEIIQSQLPPKKSVSKENKKKYTPLHQPHNFSNKSNSAPQVENENLISSKDEKQKPPRVKETPKVPFSSVTAVSKNEKILVLDNSNNEDSIIDKLSRTFEEIAVKDESHKKKTEWLDKEINNWTKILSKKQTKQITQKR